ncbi:MAG: hypothetical protein SOW34_08000 [Oliverpabstia sp.]|nr:hypothetical protein [Oliverpabstia sp.]
MITAPGIETFREYVLMIQNGIRIKDHRISKVFSSRIHGDPATPVFRAYTGDRVVFRTIMPADKPRNTSFTIHGHEWKEQRDDPYSRIIPLQGAVSIGNTFNNRIEKRCRLSRGLSLSFRQSEMGSGIRHVGNITGNEKRSGMQMQERLQKILQITRTGDSPLSETTTGHPFG